MNNHLCQRIVKRAMDMGASVLLLLVLSPLLVVIWLVIRWNMGRPAIFRQHRPGVDHRPFLLYKFRTMNDARMPDGTWRLDGERLTPLGRFLRRTSLDELPQLWNVLRGDMSLVGPRPLRLDYVPYYTEREALRCRVRPGITGWAQIHGRNRATWDQRLAADAWYVEHWCLKLDVKILVLTAVRLFRRSDVVVDPSTIMKNLNEERAHMVRSPRQS
jgi:sugar transferase EpsL